MSCDNILQISITFLCHAKKGNQFVCYPPPLFFVNYSKRQSPFQTSWAQRSEDEQESAFWELIDHGLHGKRISLLYGVDVEPGGEQMAPKFGWNLSTFNDQEKSLLRHMYV